jgi:hypothetical protein
MSIKKVIYDSSNNNIVKFMCDDFSLQGNTVYYNGNELLTNVPKYKEILIDINPNLVFKSNWYNITNQNALELTVLGLQEYKNLLISKTAENRYNKEISGYFYKNKYFYTDRETQVKYSAVYSAARDGLITSLDWKTMDDSFITLNTQEAIELSLGVLGYVQYLFSLESNLQNQINNANNLIELLNISIEF